MPSNETLGSFIVVYFPFSIDVGIDLKRIHFWWVQRPSISFDISLIFFDPGKSYWGDLDLGYTVVTISSISDGEKRPASTNCSSWSVIEAPNNK